VLFGDLKSSTEVVCQLWAMGDAGKKVIPEKGLEGRSYNLTFLWRRYRSHRGVS
jgi:hypothetical protein